jgi:hypothetical protein
MILAEKKEKERHLFLVVPTSHNSHTAIAAAI